MVKSMRKEASRTKKIIIVVLAAVLLLALIFGQNNDEIHGDKVYEKNNAGDIFVQPKYSIVNDELVYSSSGKGYIARPEKSGEKYPGIIMIHEWWGLNDNIKDMADKLASQGYVVLAVDLYGGEYATTPDKARELATSVRSNPEIAIENMKDATNYLRSQEDVEKIGSLGWCFGGQQSLQISLNEELDATVIYYGNLETDKEVLSKMKSPVLGIFGSEDTSIPVETVNEFKNSLNEIGLENSIHIYDGVGHAFANPSGNNFAPSETKDAWDKTLNFLEKNLK